MLHSSFETRLSSATPDPRDFGPTLENAAPSAEVGDSGLRIHAQRLYPLSREELFATWTQRAGWEAWLRLRARSRATLAACAGGSFRLELAEGPTIHVITGVISDLRPADFLSLTWQHQNETEHISRLDVSFRRHQQMTQLVLVHRCIASRREAAWLMRLWTMVLRRLGEHVTDEVRRALRRPVAPDPSFRRMDRHASSAA